MSTTVGRVQGAGAPDEEGSPGRPLTFTVMNTLAGHPAWWLHAPGGHLVAWSGAPFATDDAAREAAAVFRARARDIRTEVYVDAGGKYRWRAWSRAVRVAESGAWFASRSEAARAADEVRLGAASSGEA